MNDKEMKGLLERLNLDAIVGCDFESYWANDYSLTNIPTTEYICDPRFKAHMCSVQWHNEKKAKVYNPTDFKMFCRETNWKRTGILAHHTHFDGLILSRHFKTVPAFYLDTLSMLRPVLPITAGGSLIKACAAFGRVAKRRGAILQSTKGIRDLDAKQYKDMAAYAGDDISETWWLFHKLLPFLPERELHVIDATIRMYCDPKLLIDGEKVQALHDGEIKAKAAVCKRLKATPKQLRSKDQFAGLLKAEGVKPPLKESKTAKNEDGTPKLIYAFSKTDLDFKALLGHESAQVRALCRGRLRLSSSILEKRAQRMARRAQIGPQPIYLNYALALTHRWTGSDKINWQNLSRGSDLRSAIKAPPGYKLVVCDSSQIEARLLATFSGQRDIVETFAAKRDVYSTAASKIFGRVIDKKKNPQERFIGKVATLALGFQAGWARYAHTLRVGQYGPPVDITDRQAADQVQGWRRANAYIVSNWRETNNLAKQAFVSKTRVQHGCVVYEGAGAHGYMHMPNGMSIRYCELQTEDDGSVSYLRKSKPKKKGAPTQLRKRLYGGLLVENRTQALSRVLLADWIVEIKFAVPHAQLVMTTHDELVFLVKEAKAEAALVKIEKIMTTPPTWMPDLPLAIDKAITDVYEKG